MARLQSALASDEWYARFTRGLHLFFVVIGVLLGALTTRLASLVISSQAVRADFLSASGHERAMMTTTALLVGSYFVGHGLLSFRRGWIWVGGHRLAREEEPRVFRLQQVLAFGMGGGFLLFGLALLWLFLVRGAAP